MPESRFPPVAPPSSPYAAELQAFCLAFPEAWEDYPWGETVYKVGARVFTFLGGEPVAGVTVKATLADSDVLVQMPHIERSKYIGRYGWVSVQIADDAAFEHAKELIEQSYRLVYKPRRRNKEPGTRNK